MVTIAVIPMVQAMIRRRDGGRPSRRIDLGLDGGRDRPPEAARGRGGGAASVSLPSSSASASASAPSDDVLVVTLVVAVVVAVLLGADLARTVRVAALQLGLTPAELLHELVEHVAHRRRSLPGAGLRALRGRPQGRERPLTACAERIEDEAGELAVGEDRAHASARTRRPPG